jgi:hypothetical protein
MNMNSIVILCGGNSCGKTTTLRGFFGIKNGDLSPEYFVEKKLDGKTVCAVSFGSPQEQARGFCKVDKVQENINRRISECDEKATSKPYILIIPFTMSGSRSEKKKINKDCILKPIEVLKKSFKVFIIYLRKTNAHNLTEKDALMKDIAMDTIETAKKDYDKSRELEKILREKILKL